MFKIAPEVIVGFVLLTSEKSENAEADGIIAIAFENKSLFADRAV